MKNNIVLYLLLIASLNAEVQDFQYLYPKPNATLISTESNVIIRHSEYLDRASISGELLIVTGEKSGIHEGEIILSDDAKTMIFNPAFAFVDTELVSVQLKPGIKTLAGTPVGELLFKFKTAPTNPVQDFDLLPFNGDYKNGDFQRLTSLGPESNSSTLPPPPITVNMVNNPSPGNIFLATWDRNVPHQYANYLFILDNTGEIVDSLRLNGAPFDFQVQPNGLLSYAHGDFAGIVPGAGEELQHIVLDASLSRVDSFKMKNGYATDFHEFLMLPNGHAMLMSYHNVIFDMSKIVEGGRTDAILVINVIQEQDQNKNVVFEWRNIDHIPITDSDEDLTGPRINYSTLNAFTVDTDGNILASFRNHSEIMKISRTTGEIMWRWGSPRGEFRTVGESEDNAPYYFSRQHHIQRLPNGNVTLFDNGQFHTPPYSRAVEYNLDEESKTATMVSEFRYPDGNIFAAAAGNAQRLLSGGWFVGYGILAPPSPVRRNIVETHADGSMALELSLPNNVIAYRASKSLWKDEVKKNAVTKYEVFQGGTYSFNNNTDTTGVDIHYTALSSPGYYNDVTITRFSNAPLKPEFFGTSPQVYPLSLTYEGSVITAHVSEIHLDLNLFPEIRSPSSASIYWREFKNHGLFVELPTIHDPSSNELITTVSSFGEFIIGDPSYNYVANTPLPFAPGNESRVLALDSLALRWTGQGYGDSYQVQFASDSLFYSILIDTTLKSSLVYVKKVENQMDYYWRVRSVLGLESSDWSSAWSFTTADPFIEINSPLVGDSWKPGLTKLIRWETNILDSVRIDLLEDSSPTQSIGVTLGSNQAISWDIPFELNPANNYQIQVTSIVDTNIFGISGLISVADSIATGIDRNRNKLPERAKLNQNYPNPFNSRTIISYDLPEHSHVRVNIYNVNGRLVRTLTNAAQSAGRNDLHWDGMDDSGDQISTGIYFARLQTGDYSKTIKMVYLK